MLNALLPFTVHYIIMSIFATCLCYYTPEESLPRNLSRRSRVVDHCASAPKKLVKNDNILCKVTA